MDKNVIDHVFLGKGRMNRRQYWNVAILIYLIPRLLSIVMGVILAQYSPELLVSKEVLTQSLAFFPILIITLVLPLFLIGTYVRRAHDVGMSSLIAWIFTIIIIGSGYYPPAFYGSFLVTGVSVIIAIILAFYPGKKEKNTYGEQPKDLRKVSEIFRFWWTGKS